MSQLENTTSESVNVWMTSLADKYKSRPETPEFEDMCGQQAKRKNVLWLLNDLGFVQRRENDKIAVIRYYRTSQEKYPYAIAYESFCNSGLGYLPASDHAESARSIVKSMERILFLYYSIK